jgi:hypothetical protein
MTEREARLIEKVRELEVKLASRQKGNNPKVSSFIETVAESQSKYAAEAKKLLED